MLLPFSKIRAMPTATRLQAAPFDQPTTVPPTRRIHPDITVMVNSTNNTFQHVGYKALQHLKPAAVMRSSLKSVSSVDKSSVAAGSTHICDCSSKQAASSSYYQILALKLKILYFQGQRTIQSHLQHTTFMGRCTAWVENNHTHPQEPQHV